MGVPKMEWMALSSSGPHGTRRGPLHSHSPPSHIAAVLGGRKAEATTVVLFTSKACEDQGPVLINEARW